MADTDEKMAKLHALAIKRFEEIQDAERDQRRQAVEDLKFIHADDGQWDDDAKTKRADRPRYTVDKVSPAVDQVTGDQRQTRTNIKVLPLSGGADKDKAEIFDGLIRNIQSVSKAANAYDSAFDEAVAGGYGGWRVVTEFNDDDSFEQDIKIKRIKGATTSLWFDTAAEEYDKRDAKFAFLSKFMSKEEHDSKFPDSSLSNFPQDRFRFRGCDTWFNDNRVLVAEYWMKKPVIRNIALLSNGRVIDKDEESAVLDEMRAQDITIVKERRADSFDIEMYLINGLGVLKGPMKWAGKFIPLIPLFGKVIDIEGKTYVRGMVRKAKDPQRIYNYATSAAIEATALTPKDPIWITAKQVGSRKEQFEQFTIRNSPFMIYDADPLVPGAPSRGGSPAVQSALIQQIAQAGTDIHATTGIHPAALGDNPALQSGKAIQAEQQMGDRGSFIYTDNEDKSKEYTGTILVDLIPRIYDTERMIRVLNMDGSSEDVKINVQTLNDISQTVTDGQTNEKVIVNDITVGKYDVTVETGPAFNTQRQESAQQLIDLANGNDLFAQVAMDLIAKNLNVLESDELHKRVRKQMIQQGLVEPTEEEIEELGLNQEPEPDPGQDALVDNINMQTQKLISDIEKQDAEARKALVQAQGETIKTYKALMEAYNLQKEAGIPLGIDEHQLRKAQEGIMEMSQDIIPDAV